MGDRMAIKNSEPLSFITDTSLSPGSCLLSTHASSPLETFPDDWRRLTPASIAIRLDQWNAVCRAVLTYENVVILTHDPATVRQHFTSARDVAQSVTLASPRQFVAPKDVVARLTDQLLKQPEFGQILLADHDAKLTQYANEAGAHIQTLFRDSELGQHSVGRNGSATASFLQMFLRRSAENTIRDLYAADQLQVPLVATTLECPAFNMYKPHPREGRGWKDRLTVDILRKEWNRNAEKANLVLGRECVVAEMPFYLVAVLEQCEDMYDTLGAAFRMRDGAHARDYRKGQAEIGGRIYLGPLVRSYDKTERYVKRLFRDETRGSRLARTAGWLGNKFKFGWPSIISFEPESLSNLLGVFRGDPKELRLLRDMVVSGSRAAQLEGFLHEKLDLPLEQASEAVRIFVDLSRLQVRHLSSGAAEGQERCA